MICPECRYDNIEGVDYCANCGHDLAGLDQANAPLGNSGPEFIREPLSNIPSTEPVKVEVSDPAALAIRMMQRSDTDCVLVMDGPQLAGIITPWDILHKVAGGKEDLNSMSCGHIMTADPVFLREQDDVAVAINKMSLGGFRHIPLLQGDQPVAVVSIGELFKHIGSHLA